MGILIERIIAFFSAITIMFANFLGINAPLEKVEKFRVTTYVVGTYVYSEKNIHPEDFDIVTDTILFGCARFDADGNIDIDRDTLETALKNLRNAIGTRDVKISVNLLGPKGTTDSPVWEDQMEVQSIEHNKAFTSGVLEDNIVAFLDKYDFDGVHFDYEYPLTNEAWKYYNDFLVSLDKKLGSYTLGVAGSDWNMKFTNAAVAAIDTFELMLYDMSDENGRHSTFEDMKKLAFKSGINGMPIEKTNIGLPFYARPDDMAAYWYSYNEYYDKLDENGWYHCDSINKDFWFNTPDVIQEKTDYAINNGFGGVMIWHYACDLPSSHEDSLLRAIGKSISNNY
ncbi:MAG: glycoside hydrolase family 18 protein [Clostridia bacterium]|nr:glycoside hydrolase family 18 protein [Clostridia bacterium]